MYRRGLFKTIGNLKKGTALVLVGAMLVSGFPGTVSSAAEINGSEVNVSADSEDYPVADPDKVMKDAGDRGLLLASNAENSAETTETAENSSEEEETTNSDTKVLEATNGRIQFWQWKKVDMNNVDKLISDKKYTASMLVYYTTSVNSSGINLNASLVPQGFISTYADKEHIFRGLNNENYVEFDKVSSNSNEYGSFVNQFENSAFNEYNCTWIKLDEDGKSLNNHKEYFDQDVFYTQGGCRGVLWIKNKQSGNNLLTRQKDASTYKMRANIMLSRGSFKTNENDPGIYNIGSGTDGVTDYQIWRDREGSDCSCRETMMEITTNKDLSQAGHYFTLQPYKSAYNTDMWVIKGDEDLDLDDLDHSYTTIGGHGRCSMMTSNLYTENGYLLSGLVKHQAILSVTHNSKEAFSIGMDIQGNGSRIFDLSTFSSTKQGGVFKWYVGTPYVFNSLVGQGGDKETGKGGVTTIHKGELYPVRAVDIVDENNQVKHGDGTVLPEGATIVIEEGGVLSVESSLINNGKIINHGGTIIIKEGGCIAPFMNTDEGTITCDNGGNIIVMPNARLFTLSDDIRLNGFENPSDPALVLSNGSSVINFGLFVNAYAKVDKGSVIENRDGSIFLAGHNRTGISTLLSSAAVNGSSVEGIDIINTSTFAKTAAEISASGGKKSVLLEDYPIRQLKDGTKWIVYSDSSYDNILLPLTEDDRLDFKFVDESGNRFIRGRDDNGTQYMVSKNTGTVKPLVTSVGDDISPIIDCIENGDDPKGDYAINVNWKIEGTYNNSVNRGDITSITSVVESGTDFDGEGKHQFVKISYVKYGNSFSVVGSGTTVYRIDDSDNFVLALHNISNYAKAISDGVVGKNLASFQKAALEGTTIVPYYPEWCDIGLKVDHEGATAIKVGDYNGVTIAWDESKTETVTVSTGSSEDSGAAVERTYIVGAGSDGVTYYKDSEGFVCTKKSDGTMQRMVTDAAGNPTGEVYVSDEEKYGDSTGSVGYCGVKPLLGTDNSGAGTIRNDKSVTFVHRYGSGITAHDYTEYMNITTSKY